MSEPAAARGRAARPALLAAGDDQRHPARASSRAGVAASGGAASATADRSPAPMPTIAGAESSSVSRPSCRRRQEDLGDLKLYRIPEPVTVAARSQKQVALPRSGRACSVRPRLSPARLDPTTPTAAPAPSALLVTRNRTDEGLGLPLPAGRLHAVRRRRRPADPARRGRDPRPCGRRGCRDRARRGDRASHAADRREPRPGAAARLSAHRHQRPGRAGPLRGRVRRRRGRAVAAARRRLVAPQRPAALGGDRAGQRQRHPALPHRWSRR